MLQEPLDRKSYTVEIEEVCVLLVDCQIVHVRHARVAERWLMYSVNARDLLD